MDQVENEKQIRTTLRKDGFVCTSCGRDPFRAHLKVVSEQLSGQRRKVMFTLCTDCIDVPAPFRFESNAIHFETDSATFAERRQQQRWYEAQQKTARKKSRAFAMEILRKLDIEHCWDEAAINSVLRFRNDLRDEALMEAASIAADKCLMSPAAALRYFSGICWNKIKDW